MFEQMQTYKVMLSLLFENKRYAEVFELYQEIRKRLDLYELFPDITVNCLAFGACYHLVSQSCIRLIFMGKKHTLMEVLHLYLTQNTPEHFEYAQDLWQRTKNIKQLSRSKYFLGMYYFPN